MIDIGISFKPSRDIEKEFEEFVNNDNYVVILYNDEFNKRAYVQKTLMDVFSWDENKSHSIMMQAHTYGLTICGEWYKELAEQYAQQLNVKGLVAEAKPNNTGGGEE